MCNVPDDWNSYWETCGDCGYDYHASEGGCSKCGDREQEEEERRFRDGQRETCEHCGRELSEPEVVTCTDCSVAQLERLLTSDDWLRVRGQADAGGGKTLAQVMREDLERIKSSC